MSASSTEIGTPEEPGFAVREGSRGDKPPPHLLAQVSEDFRTYDRNPLEPGFWAVTVHRFGRWKETVRSPAVKKSLGVAYRVMATGADWLWGIHIPLGVKLGRRVRIWHHGCILLAARSIGDDVQIRQNTTLGPLAGRDDDLASWPVIGDRVQFGAGACVLGNVRVGSDSFIGANTVLLRSFPPGSRVMGVPGRPIPGG